jgi:hypothetical protein
MAKGSPAMSGAPAKAPVYNAADTRIDNHTIKGIGPASLGLAHPKSRLRPDYTIIGRIASNTGQ